MCMCVCVCVHLIDYNVSADLRSEGSDGGDACLWQVGIARVGKGAGCRLHGEICIGLGLHRDKHNNDHAKHQYKVVQHMTSTLVKVGHVHGDVIFIPTLAEE